MYRRTAMYFYEIHEGEDELGTAVLLGHEHAFTPDEFYALVKRARALLAESFEEGTLSEAIANELERTNGFIHVTDDKLLASVNVGETDSDTFLVTADDATRSVYVRREDDN